MRSKNPTARHAATSAPDITAEAALDLFAGPFLARVFAGLDTGPRWRRKAFDTWWTLVAQPPP